MSSILRRAPGAGRRVAVWFGVGGFDCLGVARKRLLVEILAEIIEFIIGIDHDPSPSKNERVYRNTATTLADFRFEEFAL